MAADFRITVLRYLSAGEQKTDGVRRSAREGCGGAGVHFKLKLRARKTEFILDSDFGT